MSEWADSPIGKMDIDLFFTWEAMPRLLGGAVITLEFALTSLCLSTIIGTALAIIRTVAPPPVVFLISVYISFIRSTPLLVQIFLVYYVLPLTGINLSPVVAGITALSLNSAAYVAEIVRGGLSAIPPGQIEAAQSLGIRPFVVWIRVILPQVFIMITPPIVNEFTLVLKATPLLSVITIVELMRTAQQIFASNFRPIEVLLGAALIYFVMNFSFSRFAAAIERRNAVKLA